MPQLQEFLKIQTSQQIQAMADTTAAIVERHLTARNIPQAVAESIARAVRDPVSAAFRNTFAESVVPSFEAACQNMTRQVAAALDRGVKGKC